MTTPIEILSFNLQERQFPYFTEDELKMLLENSNNDIKEASYQGCLLKSQNDSLKLSGIDLPDNQQYWLRLAGNFKPKSKSKYITSRKRADGQ